MQEYILIADSGGTKTDWLLVDGENKFTLTTSGMNPIHRSVVELEQIVRNELLPQLPEAAMSQSIYFYGSGCIPDKQPVVAGVLDNCFAQAREIEVHSDLIGAARALFGNGDGIACILGTGANSCVWQAGKIVANTPPLGYVLGDEGSGASIGKAVLNAIYKGRLPAFVRADFEQFTGLQYADVIRKVYKEPGANTFLASLAPFVLHEFPRCEALKMLVSDLFDDFFQLNIFPYQCKNLPIGFVGSIAHYFSVQIQHVAQAHGYALSHLLKSPIEALAAYHSSALRKRGV